MFLLTIQCLVIGLCIIGLYELKNRVGLTLLMVFVGANQFLQNLLASTLFFDVFGYSVSPGSAVLFSSSLFAVLLLYLKDDISSTRLLIYGIALANLSMALIAFLLQREVFLQHMVSPPGGGAWLEFFDPPSYLFGTLLLIVDAFLVAVVYEALSAPSLHLPGGVRVVGALVITLCLDTVAFVGINFAGDPNFSVILTGGLLGKGLAGLIYGIVMAIYIPLSGQKDGTGRPEYETRDLFSLLQYRERYRSLKEEKALEQRQAREALLESEGRYRELAGRLQAVREEERTEIAREIHDELGQSLTVLKMEQELLLRQVKEPTDALNESRRSLDGLLDSTIDKVRDLSQRLRPAMLDDLGLVAALDWQANDFSRRTGLTVTSEIDPGIPSLHEEVATALFRIFQETLTNVARHAGARVITVGLSMDGDDLVLEVADDGCGINVSRARTGGSLGLLGMRERAAKVGGEVTYSRRDGGGTLMSARVPLGPVA